ncbi:MAG: hypothetical protein JW909_03320 [Planctomycetes bacterium]|nr:hypothetical protein [Planctomycetota bacterium]
MSLETRGGRVAGPAEHLGSLTARTILLSDGDVEILLCVVDMLELYADWMKVFQRALESNTGVPLSRQVIWCNHVHASSSSDGAAAVPIAERIARSVEKARDGYAPAEAAFASRSLGRGWTIRRRCRLGPAGTFCSMFNDGAVVRSLSLDASGQAAAYLEERGLDPALWKKWVRTCSLATPPDTRLEILDIRSMDAARPIARMVRFPVHPVLASAVKIGNALYPDFIGTLRHTLEASLGGKTLFVCGPAGDVRPLHREYGTAAADEYGARLADAATRILQKLKYRPLDNVRVGKAAAVLPLRPEYGLPGARLKKELLQLRSRAEKESDPLRKLELLRRAEERRWVEFYRGSRPGIIPAESLRKGSWPVETGAVNFGRHVIAALPGEIFSSTGIKLRKRLGKGAWRGLMITELAQDYVSYLSPPEEYGTGGYEDAGCFFTASAENILLDAACKAVDAVLKQ